MPVWHAAAREWVKAGKLVLLGVVQELHEDRARLFSQWKGFDWPILHDPINVLELRGVPVAVAIDEQGIVRSLRPRPETIEAEFLQKTFTKEKSAAVKGPLKAPDLSALRQRAEAAERAPAWRDLGDAITLWGGSERIDDAIGAYRRAIKREPKDGAALFRLGTCYRMRYESDRRQSDDFQQAVDFWVEARTVDPGQYIWRRRVEQYASRLRKPYPFYDWVVGAKRAIAGRGEKPVALTVEPYGAEIARPAKTFSVTAEKETAPDPKGRVFRDTAGLVEVEVAVVPPRLKAGESARVHVSFHPKEKKKAHWNNEVEPLRLWIEAAEGWQVSRRLLSAPQGEGPETFEVRRLDFEVKPPASATGRTRLAAYALYYVCEDVGGTCQFLRQDIPIDVDVVK